MSAYVAVPKPTSVRDNRGDSCFRPIKADYPLTARCTHCDIGIRCADSSADWVHESTRQIRCDELRRCGAMTWEGLNPPYSTIVADPPWPLRWSGGVGGAHRNATPLPYSLMDVASIAAMPVSRLAADEAHLYLWVTPALNRLGDGVLVAKAWGFDVVDEIIWEKPNIGMGIFPRHVHEPLLICRCGSLPFTAARDVRSVQRWPQLQSTNGGKTHSAKPAAALDLVESASPGPYVELFARAPRLGWDSWGKGYEGAA